MAFQIAEAYVQISQRGASTTGKALRTMGAETKRAGASFGILNASSGQLDFALRNAIYAAEDAASVYGTQGLSGVLRATSNNITPILGLLGPLGMGLGVAAMAGTQLWMALDKTGENAKQAEDDLKEYESTLKATADRIDHLTRLRRELTNADSSEDTAGTREKLLADREALDARIALFAKQAEQARAQEEQLKMRAADKFSQSDTITNRPLQTATLSMAENLQKQAKMQGMYAMKAEEERKKALEERKRLTEEIGMAERRHQQLVRKEVVQANLEKTRAIEEEIARRKEQQAQQQSMVDQQRQAAEAQAKAYSDLVAKANKLYGIEIDKNGNAVFAGQQSLQHANEALAIERQRHQISSQIASASQLVGKIQSSIPAGAGGSRIAQEMAGMSQREQAGLHNAMARAAEMKRNDRGLFKERKDEETRRVGDLIETMIRDGLKTKSEAVAG